MEVKFGLFSCDSHAQLDRDAWTKRLSKQTWGDRIPQIVEVNEPEPFFENPQHERTRAFLRQILR